MPMKKSYTEKKTINSSEEKAYIKLELEPKQSTLDFLMSFSKAYYVREIKGDKYVELFLN